MVGRDGGQRTVTADAVYVSIGSAPTAPPGDLSRDGDGYCPRPASIPASSWPVTCAPPASSGS